MSTRLAVNSSTDSLSVELFPLDKSYIGGEEENPSSCVYLPPVLQAWFMQMR